jgi:lysyl-tRNA synthetase class 2
VVIETLQKPSSNIASCAYDSVAQTLTIAFKSGSSYRYKNVPQAVWMGLQNAHSLGEYFQRQIRGRYADERLD